MPLWEYVAMPRRLWVFWGVALMLLAGALWASRTFYQFGGFNDDACYVVGARNLLHSGRLLTNYEQDGGAAAYLPGYSLLLLPLLAVGLVQYPFLQLYSLLFTLAGATFTMLLARRRLATLPAMLLGLSYVLTPTGLSMGTTVMSDIPFACLFMAALWLGGRPAPRWTMVGLLVSLVVVIRLPGLALVGAFGLALLLRRAWKELALLALGLVPGGMYTLASALLKSGAGQYATQVSDIYSQRSVFAQELIYWSHLPGHLGREYLGGPFSPLVLLLFGLALVGIGKRRAAPETWAFLIFLGFCSVWPYLEPRYWLPLWPLLLLLSLEAVPLRFQPWLLGLLLVLPLPAEVGRLQVGARQQVVWDQRRTAYAWIRQHTEPDAVLGGVMTCCLEYYTERKVRAPGKSPFFSFFLAGAVSQGADYLVLEPDDTLMSMEGVKYTQTPPHAAAWADSCPLLERVYESPQVRVYRIQPVAWRLEPAVLLFLGAQEQESRLARSLQLCPDLTAARFKLALMKLADPGGREEGLALLREEVEQYPVDLQAALVLAGALRDQGQPEQAAEVARRALETARQLGEPTAPLEQFLTP